MGGQMGEQVGTQVLSQKGTSSMPYFRAERAPFTGFEIQLIYSLLWAKEFEPDSA
jgi:hypothetical protein